ncbi:MAG: ComEA family DNA-binding protein [Firmicutes bacterium]|nr:ComEA family DNA-binding protein [Bacillota bacterium]
MKKYIELIRSNETVNRILAEYGSQLKKIALVGVLVVAVLLAFAFKSADTSATIVDDSREAVAAESEVATIFVDIGGAVNNPMLAELPEGSRVEDAIVAAGGIRNDADLTNINRADFLEDGEKIYIPILPVSEGDTIEGGDNAAASASAGTAGTGKVNINTADSTALQTLNGVGPATAEKIIDYRNSNGRFKKTEDLKNVSGIGDKTYEKLKDDITI